MGQAGYRVLSSGIKGWVWTLAWHPITALTELTWRHMSPVHSQLKLVKWAAIMGEFCGLWIELIRVDWCQAVRVGSEWYHLKLGGCLHFLRCGRLQKAMTGIMIARRWTRGPGALTPGSHYADHRHPVCVWTCVQCVISAHITASAHPFHSFIVASLGPEQTNTRLCLCRDWSLSRHHTRNTRAPRVISLAVYADISRQHTRVIFSPSLCVWHRPSLCPTKRFLWPDKKLSWGQGPMVITWTRGEERRASQDYKRGLRTLGPPRQFFSDLTKYALTILVTDPGRGSNIMPGDRAWTRVRGMSFFLWRGSNECHNSIALHLPSQDTHCQIIHDPPHDHHSTQSQDINN